MSSAVEGGLGAAQYVRANIRPPNTSPIAKPTTICAIAPPHERRPTQPIANPRHPYSTPLSRARGSMRKLTAEADPAISKAFFVPSWRKRAVLKATGAARSPSNPINCARSLEAAVPRESPTHTTSDQELCLTRSATIVFKLGTIPKPAARSRSRTSIAKPSTIASHATRRAVVARLGAAVVEPIEVVSVARLSSVILGFIHQSESSIKYGEHSLLRKREEPGLVRRI